MRANVSVDCLSNMAVLIAAGVCVWGSFGCEVMPFIMPESQPIMLYYDYCICSLPERPGGRQLSTLFVLFFSVLVCARPSYRTEN